LLEYDDSRSGSFEPLRDVPGDKFVILGLVATKTPELESPELLTKRVTEATRYIPLERLGLSPQCGFASSIIGNNLSAEDQRAKLELVVKTAQVLWGQ
jgi:methionine synthase II (cobalamin-independent)